MLMQTWFRFPDAQPAVSDIMRDLRAGTLTPDKLVERLQTIGEKNSGWERAAQARTKPTSAKRAVKAAVGFVGGHLLSIGAVSTAAVGIAAPQASPHIRKYVDNKMFNDSMTVFGEYQKTDKQHSYLKAAVETHASPKKIAELEKSVEDLERQYDIDNRYFSKQTSWLTLNIDHTDDYLKPMRSGDGSRDLWALCIGLAVMGVGSDTAIFAKRRLQGIRGVARIPNFKELLSQADEIHQSQDKGRG
jgi:hypothetical protein